MLDRRTLLKGVSAGSGGLLLAPFLESVAARAAGTFVPPKRVIFVLFDNGWNAGGCAPMDQDLNTKTTVSVPLAGKELPHDLKPFAPFQDRLTIVQGLHGRHCAMGHGSGFAALSGIKGHDAANGETIDAALAKINPGVIPLLALGILAGGNTATAYGISAWGRGAPIAFQCQPDRAYESLFGRVGATRNDFLARKNLLDFVAGDVQRLRKRIAGPEREQLDGHLAALESLSRRDGLLSERFANGELARHAPEQPATKPEKMTELVAAQCEIASAALVAGLTNTVTISSGMGWINTLYTGITGFKTHSIGHGQQDPETKLAGMEVLMLYRHHIAKQAAGILARLQAVPEGEGTMLDNTLLVFASDCAETQHTSGANWPFAMVGTLGGTIKAGQYLSYPLGANANGNKPQGEIPIRQIDTRSAPTNPAINALYCSLLHAAGKPRDAFNGGSIAKACGPLPELLS